ncbi:class F sortase [Dictyobacter kobayashii]|uniref:Class F sortase n=1 Tax=Dictyobacter kobayashii TaxID=2014872 RepID=A0A402AF37_9CHLR|nr:class F sortase [Dictyobacter kobayashii]GCE17709.1 hypothetical protein KDK_15090 [Dictyobacter kobayashii]
MRTSRLYLGIMSICLLCILSACGGSVTQASIIHPTPRPTLAPTPTPLPPTPTPVPTPKPVVHVAPPAHIRIPAIGVDADIEPVGVLTTGNLDTPHNNPWDGAGWYDSGTRPGDQGSAVIDGHVDRPGGGPAVFWNLRYMKPGDEVIITTSTGQQLHFHTIKREAIPPDPSYLQGIFGDSSGKFLNLITCAGVWVPSQGQTSLRMLVYTELD